MNLFSFPECTPIALIDGQEHKLDDICLTASSSYDGNSGPDRSRIDTVQENALQPGWIPAFNDENQWIQVLLQVVKLVSFNDI